MKSFDRSFLRELCEEAMKIAESIRAYSRYQANYKHGFWHVSASRIGKDHKIYVDLADGSLVKTTDTSLSEIERNADDVRLLIAVLCGPLAFGAKRAIDHLERKRSSHYTRRLHRQDVEEWRMELRSSLGLNRLSVRKQACVAKIYFPVED